MTAATTADGAPKKAAKAPAKEDVSLPRPMPMAIKLAYRNLFHDRMSFFVTVIGIVFSVLLVAVQTGIYLGAQRRIAAILDNAPGDLWIIPHATKSFDDPTLLPGRERHVAVSVPGVERVDPMMVGFSKWRKPQGGLSTVLLVATDPYGEHPLPWNIIDGSREDLNAPSSVAIDKSYFKDLGVDKIGDVAEINGSTVKIAAITQGIRSFTTIPFVFTTIREARAMLNATQDQATFNIVKLAPGADIAQVRKELEARLPDAEVLPQAEFRSRSLRYWLFQTGAGTSLITGAVLGCIVGVVIVAQTLYSSTKDHINEFATLRALGANKGYVNRVILMQAVLSGAIGYTLGMALALGAVRAAQNTRLNIVMSHELALGLFLLTVGMCMIAAVSSIFKVVRIDPAAVFSR